MDYRLAADGAGGDCWAESFRNGSLRDDCSTKDTDQYDRLTIYTSAG